ncbi:MAG: TonB-dependent receptor, partial [Acidobacteria bacterium]
TIGYVGTIGHHLLSQTESNPGNAQLCLQTPGCGPFGENTIYHLNNGQTVYGTRPYGVTSGRYLSQGILDFGEVQWMQTWANSNYNSLQISANRTIGALHLLAAYTWSKSIDDSSGFGDVDINPYNHRLSRALSAFDIPQNFVVSYSYDLPFSRWFGKHRLSDGWQFSGITRFSSGLPILLGDSSDPSLCGCSGADVPNFNGQPIHFYNPRSSSNFAYFSTSSFSPAQLGVLGTANRRFFVGPGLNNTDLALHKFTRITERFGTEFRAEFFNVFNHAQFLNPGGDINSSNFGLVTAARDPRIGQLALKLQF